MLSASGINEPAKDLQLCMGSKPAALSFPACEELVDILSEERGHPLLRRRRILATSQPWESREDGFV